MKCITALIRWAQAALLALVSACTLAGPLPTEYVLGSPPAADTATVAQKGRPIVEVRRVRVPDYLDSTDIVERSGGKLIASQTGRWGERLSIGTTRALAASLASRLPNMAVVATPPIEQPARQVLVDLTAFEPVVADGKVVLAGGWTITDGSGHNVLAAEQTSLTEPLAGSGDEAIVAAMTRALDNLADQIKRAMERSSASRSRRVR